MNHEVKPARLAEIGITLAWRTTKSLLDPQGAVIFQDDGVALVHGHEPVACVNRQHREPHAEIRRQDPVAAKTLDLVIVRAGVKEAEHGFSLFHYKKNAK